MPRFAANLSMMYTEHDFLDRFAAAARTGSRPSSTCSRTTIRPPRSASGSTTTA
jgi:hypothetical protein